MSKETDVYYQELRDAINKIWIDNPKIKQSEIIELIGISPFVFRNFMDNKTTRHTRQTKIKILGFIKSMESA